jgi:hypothetical protein
MVVVEAAARNVTSLTPLLTTVGFGGLVGYLIGMAIRYIVNNNNNSQFISCCSNVFAITRYS